MRVDNISWQKNLMSVVGGYLHDEGDAIILTRYKGTYRDNLHVLKTPGQIVSDRIQNALMGIIKPEKEVLRFNKSEIRDLQLTSGDSSTMPGTTPVWYTYAEFGVGETTYKLTYSSYKEEEAGALTQLLQG